MRLDDKAGQWRAVDGRSGAFGARLRATAASAQPRQPQPERAAVSRDAKWAPRRFDDRGHDYDRAAPGLALEIDDAAVHALLAQRLKAKLSKNFGEADSIRDELQRDHNVAVHDATRSWSVGSAGAGERRVANRDLEQRRDLQADALYPSSSSSSEGPVDADFADLFGDELGA